MRPPVQGPRRPTPQRDGVGGVSSPEAVPATRTVYPRLDAPESVETGAAFTVTVGLADRPSRHIQTFTSAFQVAVTPFILTVTLLVDGFEIDDQGGAERTMRSSPENPYPSMEVPLRAIEGSQYSRARSVVVQYTVDGRLLGIAARAIDVRPHGEAPHPVPKQARPSQDWALPHTEAPDVTITIARGNDRPGGIFQWLVKTPLDVPTPTEPTVTNLGATPEAFARRITRDIESRAGDPGSLHDSLNGIASLVGDAVPACVWQVLHDVAHRVRHPTVLVVTAEPYVPWELAEVSHPWDPARTAILGAQAHLGRWIYRDHGEEPCPAHEIDVGSITVVVGEYAGTARLVEAENEAADLVRRYGARRVTAGRKGVKRAITGSPPADVLHFAVHGTFSSAGGQDGIVLNSGKILTSLDIRGYRTARPTLVFLNACQVGQQQELLGTPSGVAPSFLIIGTQAVIAPLWKVDDRAARKFAARFYRALLTGRGVSEFLARERTRALEEGAEPTALAYLFFGHPRLVAHDVRANRHAGTAQGQRNGTPVR